MDGWMDGRKRDKGGEGGEQIMNREGECVGARSIIMTRRPAEIVSSVYKSLSGGQINA